MDKNIAVAKKIGIDNCVALFLPMVGVGRVAHVNVDLWHLVRSLVKYDFSVNCAFDRFSLLKEIL